MRQHSRVNLEPSKLKMSKGAPSAAMSYTRH